MNFVLVCISIAVICFVILAILPKQKPKTVSIYSAFTPNGLLFIKHLEQLWENNSTIKPYSAVQVYQEMFGDFPDSETSSKKIDSFYTAIGLDDYVNIPEGTLKFIASEYYSNLEWDLSERYRLQFQKLETLSSLETFQKYNINLHNNEVLHYTVRKGVDWLEEKTITTSYNYGGYRFRTGGKFSYTFGSLSVLKNTANIFVTVDRGALYITNERIVFVGSERQQNRSIQLTDIIEFSLFKNGILLGKSNGRKPLIQFGNFTLRTGAPNKCDDLNDVVRVLDRILNRTQFEDIVA